MKHDGPDPGPYLCMTLQPNWITQAQTGENNYVTRVLRHNDNVQLHM